MKNLKLDPFNLQINMKYTLKIMQACALKAKKIENYENGKHHDIAEKVL